MAKQRKSVPQTPTGLQLLDNLAESPESLCTLDHYVLAAAEYVRKSHELKAGPKKAAQIRLSMVLGHALVAALKARLPHLERAYVGERKVSGALRVVNADVSEVDPLDGLRLAIELKPVNLAVGRALWNRFGDIRTFAVNLHLKFPFCVVGGVLAIPTYEASGSKSELIAALTEAGELEATPETLESAPAGGPNARRSTEHLIARAVTSLKRSGGRKREGDAPHLLEGIAVVVYDPDTGLLRDDLPAKGTGLRWEEFVDDIVTAYENRFDP